MTTYTRLNINSITYTDASQVIVKKNIGDFNSTSNFTVSLDNDNGQYDNTFSLNEDVEVWADLDSNPATTKIFLGIIEDIKFRGRENKETIELSGRDYGAILQDILVSPRIYKNLEVGEIVKSLIIQNATTTGITTTNVNATSTTIEKITFNNVSLFDAIKELAEIAGYYFYIDTDKDLHFEQRDSVSSGLTFDNTNVTQANFKQSDSDIFNYVQVFGDRQLTGAREIFGAQAGSVYTLDDKPSNVGVIGSASSNVQIQPGGILYVNDPLDEDVKFLVNYQASQVVLTSGITAGYNTGWIGSAVIIDYQRSSPLVSIRQDTASQTAYGKKDRMIVDRNIKDIDEANTRANTYLSEHKDPKIQGTLNVHGVVDVTPGETAVINIPFHNISSQTYTILNATYTFNKTNNLSDSVLTINVNKRISSFTDYFKEHELRLRKIEGAEVDTSITNLVTTTGSVSVETSYNAISRSIGSAFYFHIPGHNIFNSDSSLLGDMRAGSEVISG